MEERQLAGYGDFAPDERLITHYVRDRFLGIIAEEVPIILNDLKKNVFSDYLETKKDFKNIENYMCCSFIKKANKDNYPSSVNEFRVSFRKWSKKYNFYRNDWLINIALDTLTFWDKYGVSACWAPTNTLSTRLPSFIINAAFIKRKEARQKLKEYFNKFEDLADQQKIIETKTKKNLERDIKWFINNKILKSKTQQEIALETQDKKENKFCNELAQKKYNKNYENLSIKEQEAIDDQVKTKEKEQEKTDKTRKKGGQRPAFSCSKQTVGESIRDICQLLKFK